MKIHNDCLFDTIVQNKIKYVCLFQFLLGLNLFLITFCDYKFITVVTIYLP